MVKTFPKTECYNIYFEPGSSGNFIKTLLYKFIYGPLNMEISSLGSSHKRFHIVYENFKDRRVLANLSTLKVPIHRLIEPYDERKPIIFSGHNFPNFDDFFTVYPRGKLLLIVVPYELGPRVRGNFFYKNIVENFKSDYMKQQIWKQYQKNHPQLINVDDPAMLTPEEVKVLLDSDNPYEPILMDYDIPNTYSQSVFKISLKDILYKKDTVLSFLSDFTNKPLTEHIIEFYEQYLIKQDELVKNKMPWVTV